MVLSEYEPKIRLFITLLLLVGLMASLYVPTSVIKLTADLYEGTASPHNSDYLGTSTLVNLLKSLGYSVEIAETQEDFINHLKDKCLAIIIAPDNEATPKLIDVLLKSYIDGEANILIADENITSNKILKALANIEIDGRAVFSYQTNSEGKRTPFPEVIMSPYLRSSNYSMVTYVFEQPSSNSVRTYRTLKLMVPSSNSSKILLRLNWASFIKPCSNETIMNWVKGYFLLGVTTGLIDLNNDGKLETNELSVQPETLISVTTSGTVKGKILLKNQIPLLIEGLAIPSKAGSVLFVFSDSFPFTNQALAPKNSPYKVYLKELLSSTLLSKKAVICDCLYRINPKALKIPYHPAILMYFATSMLHLFDSKVTQAINESPLISITTATVLVLLTALLISKALGGGAYINIEPSGVEEISIITETEVKRSLLKGGPIKNPKEAIKSTWEILNYVFQKVLGHTAEEILNNRDTLSSTAKALGVSPKSLRKDLKWLQTIYLKAEGKSILPIFLFWRRTIKKYVVVSDKVLNYVGYTLLKKGGLKGVESILH